MRKNTSRRTITRNVAATVLIGLTLALSANAATGTGYAFIDSVAAFLGFTTENSAQTEQAMASNSAEPMEPAVFFAACASNGSGGTLLWGSATTWTSCGGGIPTS